MCQIYSEGFGYAVPQRRDVPIGRTGEGIDHFVHLPAFGDTSEDMYPVPHERVLDLHYVFMDVSQPLLEILGGDDGRDPEVSQHIDVPAGLEDLPDEGVLPLAVFGR